LAGAKVWILPWPKAIASTGETARRPAILKMLRAGACLRPFTRRLAELLDEIGPAALVTNAVKPHIIGALTRKQKDVPLIWYMHDGLEERVVSRKLLALLSRRCDMAICISEYVASQFREYVSASVPAHVVYNIVDLNRFHPEALPPADLRKGLDEIWFGMVGAITPLKGHDIFLDTAERVLRQLPQAVFLIVGSNPYVTEAGLQYEDLLRRRVGSSSLLGRVKFVGFRDDVPSVLSQLDVLVQPNRGPEGLGRSVLEAMACGVPVIAVDKWGPAELIEHGRSGLLFPPRDAEKLATHMLTLARSKPLRKAMGKHGHDWIQQNLISKKLAGQFDGILACAIASPR
jgi:glycosyltransferase involved in cell wall biosynthesis